MIRHPILTAGIILFLFAVAGVGLVAFVHGQTAARIAANEREALLSQLRILVPKEQVDNDMLEDTIVVSAPEALGAEKTLVYIGRREGLPVAAVLSPVITQGYSGPIQMIVAIQKDGRLAGVRVLSHRETPGLGDKIEVERSDWILGFAGKSLLQPAPSAWQVKRDGGEFDQFTGATITPRAIVRGVRAALEYFHKHKPQLFDKEQPREEETNG